MNQPKIGMLRAMKQCADYSRATDEARRALRDERLRRMVAWAKERSPYYARLYAGIGDAFSLSDLPPVTKPELMAHWDEWVTDREMTLDGVNAFMRDPDNVGRKYKGRCLVFTTSGSTGRPLVALCDDTTNHVMGAVNAARSFARKADLRSFILRGGKTIGVFATSGFYLSNGSVRARLLAMPWKKRQMAVTSALLPTAQIVSELNAFQPAMLGGYPSNLELLIDERRSGRLDISPVLIMTGGEFLSDTLRAALSETFGCYVQTSYACTEGGTIACECERKHLHINDDWVIVEPVDRDNRPVPPGERSDKLLLTNLFNFTQPFLRYELTDRVTLHTEPCACGCRSPWLTLEGRTDDVVRFAQDGRAVALAPLAIYATLKETHALRRFQLIAIGERSAELRLEPVEGVTAREAFAQAQAALERFFAAHGLTGIALSLSADPPRQDAGSGKFKHIVARKG